MSYWSDPSPLHFFCYCNKQNMRNWFGLLFCSVVCFSAVSSLFPQSTISHFKLTAGENVLRGFFTWYIFRLWRSGDWSVYMFVYICIYVVDNEVLKGNVGSFNHKPWVKLSQYLCYCNLYSAIVSDKKLVNNTHDFFIFKKFFW